MELFAVFAVVVVVSAIVGLLAGSFFRARWLFALTVLAISFVAYVNVTASGGWAGEGYFEVALYEVISTSAVVSMWVTFLVRLAARSASQTPPIARPKI